MVAEVVSIFSIFCVVAKVVSLVGSPTGMMNAFLSVIQFHDHLGCMIVL